MLKIENLHVSIEDKTILNGLNLEVNPGEVHAIMGPNGSGKSTLSAVIAGNEDYEVTKGNIFYKDENIEDLSAEERAHKGISAGKSQNSYRGLVQIGKNAENARNFSQCDSLLMGNNCGAHTFPYIEAKNKSAQIEHEATTSKIGEDQIFYCNQRGIDVEKAIALIVNGFSKEVLNKLPMEFAVEAQKLLEISLEGSVG